MEKSRAGSKAHSPTPASSPGREASQLFLHFLTNEANRLNEKRKVGLARRASRVNFLWITLVTGPTFLHVNTLAKPSQDNRDFKIQRRGGNENVA